MSITYTFTNNKGGVGKTTSATNTAYALARCMPKPVLLIDSDSQGHSSLLTTGSADHGPDHSLYAVMMARPNDIADVVARCIVTSNWHPNLHVLPASQYIEKAQAELVTGSDVSYRLAHAIQAISSRYSGIVIDTQPSFSQATHMALLASDWAFIPVEPRYLEIVGLTSIVQKIRQISAEHTRSRLHVGGVLLTKVDQRVKGHRETVAMLNNHPALGNLYAGAIPLNEAIPYSHHSHQSIFTYDPSCRASIAYAQFVKTLLEHMRVRGQSA